MKKYMVLILVMAVFMSLAGVSAAADSVPATGVVGEDIEIGEDEMKIVSMPEDQGGAGGADEVAPIAPDELLQEEQERVDAANGDSASTDNDSDVVMAPVEDLDMPDSDAETVEELSDQELADLAAQSGVVGEDIEIGDDEMKIVSFEEETKAGFNWPLAIGIAGGVIILGVVVILLIKKSRKAKTAA